MLPSKVKLVSLTAESPVASLVIVQNPFAFVFPSTPAISTLSPEERLWVAVVICIGLAEVAAVIARDGAEIPQFRTASPSYFFLSVDRAKKICPIWLPKLTSVRISLVGLRPVTKSTGSAAK